MAHELPPLPYPAEALEPHIDKTTMEIHHGKHYATYVNNYNDAIKKQPELDGKPPMGDENDTNHRREAPAGAVAPHEWAAIIMIQSPSSRARGPIVVGCCIAVNGPAGGFRGMP